MIVMVTQEKEAAELACPFRFGESKASHVAHWNCITTACMAWQRSIEGAKCEDRRGVLQSRDLDGTGKWHYAGRCLRLVSITE